MQREASQGKALGQSGVVLPLTQTDERTNGQTDRRTNGQTDGRTRTRLANKSRQLGAERARSFGCRGQHTHTHTQSAHTSGQCEPPAGCKQVPCWQARGNIIAAEPLLLRQTMRRAPSGRPFLSARAHEHEIIIANAHCARPQTRRARSTATATRKRQLQLRKRRSSGGSSKAAPRANQCNVSALADVDASREGALAFLFLFIWPWLALWLARWLARWPKSGSLRDLFSDWPHKGARSAPLVGLRICAPISNSRKRNSAALGRGATLGQSAQKLRAGPASA